MKMKSLFVAMMALATLASCSNEDDATNVETGETKSVSLSLNYASTRGIEDPETGGRPILTNIYVLAYLTKECTGQPQPIPLTTEQTAALTAGKVEVSIPANSHGIKMIANNGLSTTAPDIITSYQGKRIKTEIPYVGQSVAGVTGDDVAGYKAAITIAPQVARVETSGIINATNAANGCTVTINGIYMNKYIANLSAPEAFVSLKSTDGTSITSGLMTGMYNKLGDVNWSDAFKLDSPTKCAGYQLFAGLYGVTLAVTVTPAVIDEENKPVTGFVVIKKFKDIATLEAGKIYKLNLTTSGLEDEFQWPDVPVGPDPSGDTKEVEIAVTVSEWTEVAVTPEL